MSEKLKIWFISAEVDPFAKTGGLGDIGNSLPKALYDMGHDVRIVMPAYKKIEDGYPEIEPLALALDVQTGVGQFPAGVFGGKLPGSDVPVYFIAERNLFYRDNLYGYGDDVYRFAFFSLAAMQLTAVLDWKPDIIHAHDWHTAPAITWLATAGQGLKQFQGIASIFTIHNLAHQGKTNWDIFNYMGIHSHSLAEEGYGEVNFMARGIYHATMVSTVSPTYAREITTFEGGAGLHGLLSHRHFDLHGILNGLDVDTWNPQTDTRLASTFSASNLQNRQHNRRALQAHANLPQRDDIPLVAMITRLDWQKGLDITGHVLHQLLNNYAGEAQFIVLGTGQKQYEDMLAGFAHYHSNKMTAYLSYDANFAPLIYGGSDIFLMPSLFEPCGLGQMIAMRYGSVPVVRSTGGLADTVQDSHNGFTFHEYSSHSFWHALSRAIYVFNVDKMRWHQIQQNGMTTDFSWGQSAKGYEQLYQWAIARTRQS